MPTRNLQGAMLAALDARLREERQRYLERGRIHATLSDDALRMAWKAAYRSYAADAGDRDAALTRVHDLGAELGCRSIDLPDGDDDMQALFEDRLARLEARLAAMSREELDAAHAAMGMGRAPGN